MYWNGFNYSVFLIRMIDLEITKRLRIINPTVSAAAGSCCVYFILSSAFSASEVSEAATDMAESTKTEVGTMKKDALSVCLQHFLVTESHQRKR